MIKLYKAIAREMSVLDNPKADQQYIAIALANIDYFGKEMLPSGSGFDSGCSIDLNKSTANKIVIQCDFHHMNENGYYDGWTYHTCVITPSLGYDYDLKVTGRDKREIKNYIGDVIYETLEREITNKIEHAA
jgi:hypothetical protein